MLGAEEVAAGRHRLDRLEAKLGLIHLDRLEELSHVLQHLDIQHQFLKRCGQTTLLPACRMVDQIAMPQY